MAEAQRTTGLISPPTSGPKLRAAVRAHQQHVAARRRAATLKRQADRAEAGRRAERYARNAEQAYADLGRSVASQAALQGAVARGQRATAGETFGGKVPLISRRHPATAPRGKYAELNRQAFGAIGKTPAELAEIAVALNERNPAKRVQRIKELRRATSARKSAEMSVLGQQILEQVTRGAYAVGGGIRAAKRGEDISQAVGRGARLQDHYLPGEVLTEGWTPNSALGRIAKGAVATTGDVALDPTSYLTLGVSSVARKAAVQAARAAASAEAKRVMARELGAGATRTAARRVARAEGAKAGEDAYERHIAQATARERERVPHVSIGAGRYRVGTPVRPTAAFKRGTRGARQATARQVEKVAPRTVAKARRRQAQARDVLAETFAPVRPSGLSAEQWARTREIARTKRATSEQIARRGGQRAATLRILTRPAEQKAIRDAIEADDLGRLKGIAEPLRLSPRVRNRTARALAADPDRLYKLAQIVKRDPELLRERALQAGIPIGYVGPKPKPKIKLRNADVRAAYERVQRAKTPAEARAAVANLRRVERLSVTQKTQLRAAARRAAEAKGYVPRVRTARVAERGPLTLQDVLDADVQRVGGAKRPRPSQRRKVTEPMAELERRAAAGDRQAQRYIAEHTEDLPLALRSYAGGLGRGIAHAEANRALVAEGRPVLKGEPVTLAEGERVYAHEGSDLRELKPSDHGDADEIAAIEAGKAKGDYIVLPKAMVEHVTGTEARTQSVGGQAFDRFWGHWKSLALLTPGYPVRNALGDAFAAYGAQNPAQLARNYIRGQRALNEYARSERAYKWFESEMGKGGKGTTTTVNGEPIRYRELALEAEAAGAIRQGRLAEIRDLMSSGRAGKAKATEGGWRRMIQRVEDSARLATYIGMRERGLAPEAAAAQVAKVHFDYGELTRRERALRRAMPFYTFQARNLPRMLQLLATRPGKLAAVEKAREEFQKTSGLPADYLEGLPDYEQRQLGLPVRIGGKAYTVSAGLPFADLSDLPFSGEGARNLAFRQLGALAPFPKTVVEELLNVSAFYRDTIEDPHAPRTPVPRPVAALADDHPELRRRLGIKRIVDKRTGKRVWGWHKKLDYGIRQVLPGLFGAAYRLSQPSTAREFSPPTEALGLAGIRARPYEPTQVQRNRLYDQLKRLNARRAELNQAGVYAANATPEWRRISAQIRTVQKQIDATQQTPRGPRVRGAHSLPPRRGGDVRSGARRLPPPRTR